MRRGRHDDPVDVDPATELDADRHTEDRVFYKTVFAVVLTAAVAVARQRWWV